MILWTVSTGRVLMSSESGGLLEFNSSFVGPEEVPVPADARGTTPMETFELGNILGMWRDWREVT